MTSLIHELEKETIYDIRKKLEYTSNKDRSKHADNRKRNALARIKKRKNKKRKK